MLTVGFTQLMLPLVWAEAAMELATQAPAQVARSSAKYKLEAMTEKLTELPLIIPTWSVVTSEIYTELPTIASAPILGPTDPDNPLIAQVHNMAPVGLCSSSWVWLIR